MRIDEREPNQIRETTIARKFTKFAPGSVLIQMGDTKVICTASVEEAVPSFLEGTGQGWVTAEYSMLPASTAARKPRESTRRKVEGRTQEIQRLIGRSMRAIVDLNVLGERTIWIDCDVIQADGGTRTASITGGYVALVDAVHWLEKNELISEYPLRGSVVAVSVGIVDGTPLLDLCYSEDAVAQVDMNVIMTGDGKFVEVQGTGEEHTFTEQQLTAMLTLAKKGINELTEIQKVALKEMVDGQT